MTRELTDPAVGAEADILRWAVAALERIAVAEDRDDVAGLRQRVASRRLRVLVAGEAKRGKSTLVNRLIGREVMPVGVIPVTALSATVHGGDADRVLIRFNDGRSQDCGLDSLPEYVTEQQNPENVKGVAAIDVVLADWSLSGLDLELVDTPGTGSVFEHNTTAADRALDTLDAAIVVLTVDPPISAAERDLLTRVRQRAVRTFIVLNKADQLTAAELDQAAAFTRRICQSVVGAACEVYPCSARLGTGDAGFAQFAQSFGDYLRGRGRQDMETALRSHLRRSAAAMLDAARVQQRAAELLESDASGRVDRFAHRLREISERGREIPDRCWAARRAQLRELDDSAAHLIDELTRRCSAEISAAVGAEFAGATPDEITDRAHQLLVGTVRTAVDGWRAGRSEGLVAGLDALWDRLYAELAAGVAELRTAATELLDLSLSVGLSGARLPASEAFFYAFETVGSWEPPLAGAVRRLAPGRAGRARRQALAEIADQVDRQVGRARADLARRLTEGVHRVSAGLQREYQGTFARLESALAQAQRGARAAHREAEQGRADLSARLAALTEIVDRLA